MADVALRSHLLPDRFPQSPQRACRLGMGLPATRPPDPHHPRRGARSQAQLVDPMRYRALATDYDGTLASHGAVAPETLAALERLAATDRRLILVTGRRIDDLIQVFPEVAIFDRVVAENGPLLYRPKSRETRLLSQPPPAAFVDELRRRGVQ